MLNVSFCLVTFKGTFSVHESGFWAEQKCGACSTATLKTDTNQRVYFTMAPVIHLHLSIGKEKEMVNWNV